MSRKNWTARERAYIFRYNCGKGLMTFLSGDTAGTRDLQEAFAGDLARGLKGRPRSIILFRLQTITTDSTANQRRDGPLSGQRSDKYLQSDPATRHESPLSRFRWARACCLATGSRVNIDATVSRGQ